MISFSHVSRSSRAVRAARAFSTTSPLAPYIVMNPCNNETLGHVTHHSHAVTAAMINSTIATQTAAFPAFSNTPSNTRSTLLTNLSNTITNNADDLANIMALESGKPIREAQGEIAYATSYIDYYAASCSRPEGIGGGSLIPTPFASSTTPGHRRGKLSVINSPVGVSSFITPWNFPLAMLARKAAPALAAGCPSLTKPSEHAPLTAIALQTLAQSIGIGPDLLAIHALPRTQSKLFGDIVCGHDDVKKISFTGSTTVGKYLQAACGTAGIVKRVSLELGGNAPFIVCSDADIPVAVAATIASKFRNAGQTCVCSDRFLVHEKVMEEFVGALVEAVEALTIGGGVEDGDVGPLIDGMAVELMDERVTGAVEEGAVVVTGGKRIVKDGGNFFEPTVIVNVSPESDCFRKENFGPVVAITTFGSDEEAVEIVRASSDAGLASYVMTESYKKIEMYTRELQFGLVGVNEGVISTAHAPFGGVGSSGIGREGSVEGIKEYTYQKYVYQHC